MQPWTLPTQWTEWTPYPRSPSQNCRSIDEHHSLPPLPPLPPPPPLLFCHLLPHNHQIPTQQRIWSKCSVHCTLYNVLYSEHALYYYIHYTVIYTIQWSAIISMQLSKQRQAVFDNFSLFKCLKHWSCWKIGDEPIFWKSHKTNDPFWYTDIFYY